MPSCLSGLYLQSPVFRHFRHCGVVTAPRGPQTLVTPCRVPCRACCQDPAVSLTPFKGCSTVNCFHLHPRRHAPCGSRLGFSSFPPAFLPAMPRGAAPCRDPSPDPQHKTPLPQVFSFYHLHLSVVLCQHLVSAGLLHSHSSPSPISFPF